MSWAGSHYLKGAVFGVAAASIWASWSAITRLAVTIGFVADNGWRLHYCRLARLDRSRGLERLTIIRRCAFPHCGIPDGRVHRRHAAGETRSTSCGGAGLDRIAGNLFASLSRLVP